MAPTLSDQWLAILDEATSVLAQLRSGSVRVELFESATLVAEAFTAWCTASQDAIDLLALTSLAAAYQFRRTFDRRRKTVLLMISEINRHVSSSL